MNINDMVVFEAQIEAATTSIQVRYATIAFAATHYAQAHTEGLIYTEAGIGAGIAALTIALDAEFDLRLGKPSLDPEQIETARDLAMSIGGEVYEHITASREGRDHGSRYGAYLAYGMRASFPEMF